MKITLNRNQVFLIGLAVMLTFLLINRLRIIIPGAVTEGTVIRFENNRSHPVIRYCTDDRVMILFTETYMELRKGDMVPVIYKRSDPADARIFSIIDFWLPFAIWCIVPLLLMASAVFSFLYSSDIIVIRLKRKIPGISFHRNEKQIE